MKASSSSQAWWMTRNVPPIRQTHSAADTARAADRMRSRSTLARAGLGERENPGGCNPIDDPHQAPPRGGRERERGPAVGATDAPRTIMGVAGNAPLPRTRGREWDAARVPSVGSEPSIDGRPSSTHPPRCTGLHSRGSARKGPPERCVRARRVEIGPMKDAVLTRLFLRYRERGDGRALAAVFDLTAKELLAVAAHLARDAAEAEDLVQIVFLRAMERAPAFDRAHGLRGWLHGILWREALAARRRAARRVAPAELERAGEADPAEAAAERELPAAVRAALEGLPRRYREVVEPLLFGEKAAHEIAAELGRSSGTVRMQIHRGLDRLRRALQRGL